MFEGGRKLARIKSKLIERVKEGVNAFEIEDLATKLIKKTGAKPSFQMVPGYSWSTCINVNDGLVHGVPKKEIVFQEGDLVSIDVGLFYRGFHSDTSTSVLIGKDEQKSRFLLVGKKALSRAIKAMQIGNRLMDISAAIENTLREADYRPIKSLVGHGVGRELHQYPPIPCFLSGSKAELIELREGYVFAIEVMYSQGTEDVRIDDDGWTVRTKDGKMCALFEETVALTSHGPTILTASRQD